MGGGEKESVRAESGSKAYDEKEKRPAVLVERNSLLP